MNNRISTARLVALAAGAALLVLRLPAFADGGICDFHMDVQDSFKLSGGWQYLTGAIGSGTVRVGDAVQITLADGSKTVRSADRIGAYNQLQKMATKGQSVAIGFANADKDGLGDAVALEGHCGAAPAPVAEAPEPQAAMRSLPTKWYAGLRITTSPGGKEFQGAVEALIERVYDRPNGTIADTILETASSSPLHFARASNRTSFP